MSKKIPVASVPELMEIWDWNANTIVPEELGKRSDTKVWWICPNGHDHYLQSPRQKSKNLGCPKCNIKHRAEQRTANKIQEKGSLLKIYPEIASEWDYDKNEISPEEVLAGSHVKYWWKCSYCSQSYLMSPNMRSSKKRGCPDCGIKKRGVSKNKNLLNKYGSLAKTHPFIAEEWSYENNNDTPDNVHAGMPDIRWWKCPYGHPSYQQAIRDRVRRGYGCPLCHGENQTSFPEQVIFYYVKKVFPDAQNRYKDTGFELDIYIPNLKVGIEYDGAYWHRNKALKERQKDSHFSNKGIRVIHVTESNDKENIKNTNYIPVKITSDYSYLDFVVKKIGVLLGITIDNVDVKRDTQVIWRKYILLKKQNSLEIVFPNISQEWDYKKNTITPDKVTPFSRKKVFWLCSNCGNSYQMVIGDRTGNKKCGCPKCGFEKRNKMQRAIKEKNISRIAEYRKDNPHSSISECVRSLNLSYPTVKKCWESKI